ncbi:MAG: arsenate reductase (azurin) small subunit [Actinobacteria bacterium]|nr:arsenate reductase (azurin) small subunit [Actinomycetota bacterium]
MSLTRREFVFLGAAGGAAAAAGVILPVGLSWDRDEDGEVTALVLQYPEVVVGSYLELEIGTPSTFEYPAPGQPNVLARLGMPAEHGIGPEEDLVAFSSLCTHMGCPVTEFQSDEGVLGPCPCHFTSFDLAHDGQPAIGQATQRLPRVLLRLDGDEIVATGLRRHVYGYADNLQGVGVELLQSS